MFPRRKAKHRLHSAALAFAAAILLSASVLTPAAADDEPLPEDPVLPPFSEEILIHERNAAVFSVGATGFIYTPGPEEAGMNLHVFEQLGGFEPGTEESVVWRRTGSGNIPFFVDGEFTGDGSRVFYVVPQAEWDQSAIFISFTGDGEPVFYQLDGDGERVLIQYRLQEVITDTAVPGLEGPARMASLSGTPGFLSAKDQIRISFFLSDGLSGVDPESVLLVRGDVRIKPVFTGADEQSGFLRFEYTAGVEELAPATPKDGEPALARLEFTVLASDMAGNTAELPTFAGITDIYLSAPEIALTGISSTNLSGGFVKSGDTVTGIFTSSTVVEVVSASVMGNPVTVTRAGDYKFVLTGKTGLPDAGDSAQAVFSMTVRDQAGRVLVLEFDTGLTYLRPISVSGISLTSDNPSKDAVKKGDTITLTYLCDSSVPPQASLTLFGLPVTPVQTGPGVWQAQLVLDDTVCERLKNLQTAGFVLLLWDQAGNTFTTDSLETGRLVYHVPLSIQANSVAVVSTNLLSPKSMLGHSDSLVATFKTNSVPTVKSVTVNSVEYTPDRYTLTSKRGKDGQFDCRLTVKPDLSALTDYGQVSVTAVFTDEAGNPEIAITNAGSDTGMLYVSKLSLTGAASLKSTSRNQGYLSNGSTVTLQLPFNHKVSDVSAEFGNRRADVSGTESGAVSVSFSIPKNEAALTEGLVELKVRVTDEAGNEYVYSDPAAKFIYDRTKPVLQVDCIPGTHNRDVPFSFTVNDANLDMASSFVRVNGENMLATLTAINAYEEGTLTLSRLFSDEGRYVVSAYCVDLAGNVSDEKYDVTVIIDKTPPLVRLKDKAQSQDGTPRFQPGVRIDDLIEIVGGYASVTIQVDGIGGVESYSLRDAITSEGHKYIRVSAYDAAYNVSLPFVYELIIDKTAPQIEVLIGDGTAFRPVEPSSPVNVFSASVIKVRLAQPVSDDDRIITLLLRRVDADKSEDMLALQPDEQGYYTLKVSSSGVYQIEAVAVDGAVNVANGSIGNSTGYLIYGPLNVQIPVSSPPGVSDTPFPYVPAFGLLITVSAVGVFAFMKWHAAGTGKRRKKSTPQTTY